jgi:hypothetical protein
MSRRWVLLSGWLEIGLGLGHNVLGTMILVRPTLVVPIVAVMGWPMAILTPIAPREQLDLVLATSLAAGNGVDAVRCHFGLAGEQAGRTSGHSAACDR